MAVCRCNFIYYSGPRLASCSGFQIKGDDQEKGQYSVWLELGLGSQTVSALAGLLTDCGTLGK